MEIVTGVPYSVVEVVGAGTRREVQATSDWDAFGDTELMGQGVSVTEPLSQYVSMSQTVGAVVPGEQK